MRLSTPKKNDLYTINNRKCLSIIDYFKKNKNDLYYIDYLFRMKDLRPKFNGKIIHNINCVTVVKNCIKHLQSILNNNFSDDTINRSDNTIRASIKLRSLEHLNEFYVQEKKMFTDLFFKPENFYFFTNKTFPPFRVMSARYISLLFSSVVVKSFIEEKRDNLLFNTIENDFNVQTNFNDRYSFETKVLYITITKRHCYDRNSSLPGTGSKLAEDICAINEDIISLGSFAKDIVELISTDDYIEGTVLKNIISLFIIVSSRFEIEITNFLNDNIENSFSSILSYNRSPLLIPIELNDKYYNEKIKIIKDNILCVCKKIIIIVVQMFDLMEKCDGNLSEVKLKFDVKKFDALMIVIYEISYFLSNIRSFDNILPNQTGMDVLINLFEVDENGDVDINSTCKYFETVRNKLFLTLNFTGETD